MSDALVLTLGANNAQLNRALKESETVTRRTASQLQGHFNHITASHGRMSTSVKLGAAAAAAALVATTAKIASMTSSNMDLIDSLGKTADKLGIATEELAGLRHASELTGAGAATLDASLQRMVKRTSEAADGTGAAKDAIRELGLSAIELNQLSPDEQFKTLADAMRDVENHADKVRIATDLFGNSGAKLVNTLALGRRGLNEVAQEAKDLGIAFNRMDVKKVEDANDAITRMGAAASGLGQSFTVAVSPAIEFAASAIEDMNRRFIRLVNDVEGAKLTGFRKEMRDLQAASEAAMKFGDIKSAEQALGEIRVKTRELAGEYRELQRAVAAGSGEITDLDLAQRQMQELAIASQQLELFVRSQGGAKSGFKKLEDDYIASVKERQAQMMADLNTPDPESGSGGGSQKDALGDEAARELEAEIQAMQAKKDALFESLMNEREILEEDYAERLTMLEEFREKGLATEQEYNNALYRAEDEFLQKKEALERRNSDTEGDIKKERTMKDYQNLMGFYSRILTATDSNNKSRVKMAKMLNSAIAVMSTYKSATEALDGTPYGFAMAAAHIIYGFQQVSNINSQEYGSSSSGGSAATPPSPQEPQQFDALGEQQQRFINVSIDDDGIYGGTAVRRLVERINEEYGDGVIINGA